MFGRWQGTGPEGNGRIDCPFCIEGFQGDRACGECLGYGIFECTGSGDPSDFMSGEEDPQDYLELARFILFSRIRTWSPAEYLAESAVFIQAHRAFEGYFLRLFNEWQERQRNELDRKAKEGVSRG